MRTPPRSPCACVTSPSTAPPTPGTPCPNARPLIEAASELPAFTQHSFTDYLIDLEEEQGSLDYVPMRVDLARAFADHGITA